MKTSYNSRYYTSSNVSLSTGLTRLNELKILNNNDSTLVNCYVIDILSSLDVLLFVYGKLKAKFEKTTFDIKNLAFDNVNLNELNNISTQLKNSKFQFKAGKVTRKKSEQFFDVVSHRDLIVQEAMRLILKAVFEGNFSAYSHSFQSFKGKHTALQEISFNFGGAAWVLEGAINECFDAFDYKILIKTISLRIQDTLFLELIWKCFKAGYINLNFIVQAQPVNIFFTKDFILTPILFNIYFDLVDKWVENKIKRFDNQKQRHKQLNYVRYADNFLIALHGSKKDCFLLKNEFLRFLINKLQLNLVEEKIRIIYAKNEFIRFLGTLILFYFKPIARFIKTQSKNKQKILLKPKLIIPIKTIIQKLEEKGFCRGGVNGRPTRVGSLIHFSLEQIIYVYVRIAKSYLKYYSFASNYFRFRIRLLYILEYSLVLTFASKLKLKTKRQVFYKFGYPITIKNKQIISFDTKTLLRRPSKFAWNTPNPDQILDFLFNTFRSDK
jgi:RNA-directed DNA polymerase